MTNWKTIFLIMAGFAAVFGPSVLPPMVLTVVLLLALYACICAVLSLIGL